MIELVKHIKNLLKTTALLLILISIVTPFTYQITQVFAQDYDIQMEIKYKDGSKADYFYTEEYLLNNPNPIPELQPTQEPPKIESLLTPEQYKQIEEKEGVTYDEVGFATVNKATLQELGYNSQEIADIQLLADNYNANPIHSVEIVEKEEETTLDFGVQASASEYCKYATHEEKFTKVEGHLWGIRYTLSNCGVTDFKADYDVAASAYTLAGIIAPFTPCSAFCATIAGVIAWNAAAISASLDRANSECNDEGAILDLHYSSVWWVHNVC